MTFFQIDNLYFLMEEISSFAFDHFGNSNEFIVRENNGDMLLDLFFKSGIHHRILCTIETRNSFYQNYMNFISKQSPVAKTLPNTTSHTISNPAPPPPQNIVYMNEKEFHQQYENGFQEESYPQSYQEQPYEQQQRPIEKKVVQKVPPPPVQMMPAPQVQKTNPQPVKTMQPVKPPIQPVQHQRINVRSADAHIKNSDQAGSLIRFDDAVEYSDAEIKAMIQGKNK